MTGEAQATAVATARRIEELDEDARRHKRAASRHRRASRRSAREADALRADLARLGLDLEVRDGR